MSVFRTTPEEALKANRYAVQMEAAGHPSEFVSRVLLLAQRDQGVFELMELWSEAESSDERDRVIADLEEVVAEEADLQGGIRHPRSSGSS